MKRYVLLAAVLAFAAIALAGPAVPGRKAEAPLAERMTGVWTIKGGEADIPKDSRFLKFITSSRWCVVSSSMTTGQLTGGVGGRFTLEGDTYTETVEYSANPDMIGKKLTFKLTVEGDTFTQTGVDNPHTAVLKRAKD
jgi:hypothetical protein